jgi:hypothetical protein
MSDLTCHKISPNADKPYNKSILDDLLSIDNKLALMTIIFILSAGLFISTIGTYADDSSVLQKSTRLRQ